MALPLRSFENSETGGPAAPPLLPFFSPVSVSLCLGAPSAWNKARPRRWGERRPGSGMPAAHKEKPPTSERRNVFHWQERGAAAGTPNFKLRKPTGWRPSGKQPLPRERKKGGEMRVAHRARERVRTADRPRPRGPLPASSLPRVRCPGPGGRLP